MIYKYIILEENNSPIIFERLLLHSDVAKPFGAVRSAGFCELRNHQNEIKIKCFGGSSTLNIYSIPTEDAETIRESLNLNPVNGQLLFSKAVCEFYNLFIPIPFNVDK